MFILGIDPGKNGAMVAIVGSGVVVDAAPLPYVDDLPYAPGIVQFALENRVTHIALEATLKMAQGGHHTRMTEWGIVRGACQMVDAEVLIVEARNGWQKWAGLGSDKRENVAWAIAHDYYPPFVMTKGGRVSRYRDGEARYSDGHADAFIMAMYYLSILKKDGE